MHEITTSVFLVKHKWTKGNLPECQASRLRMRTNSVPLVPQTVRLVLYFLWAAFLKGWLYSAMAAWWMDWARGLASVNKQKQTADLIPRRCNAVKLNGSSNGACCGLCVWGSEMWTAGGWLVEKKKKTVCLRNYTVVIGCNNLRNNWIEYAHWFKGLIPGWTLKLGKHTFDIVF